jgi:hypothetical protein
MSAIYWHENPAFDAPELGSPQPCIHGAGCVYTVKDTEGKTIPGCCRYVHPGEEGTGRRLFPAREGQSACVRLINAGFYERRRLRLPWQAWCELKSIPFVRNEPGVKHAPVKRTPFAAKPVPVVAKAIVEEPVNVMAMAESWPALPPRPVVHDTRIDGWGGQEGCQEGCHSPRPWRKFTSHEIDDDYCEEDSKCTFCGAMESECGGDHADEMRDIMRAKLGRHY